jgi:lysophospholipase
MIDEKIIDESELGRTIIGHFPSQKGEETIYYRRLESLVKSEDKEPIHLVIVHDFGEYHARHRELPFYLKEKMGDDIQVSWLDLKGHGLSSGTRGFVRDFDEYTLDLAQLLLKFKENGLDKKIVLLGHGMGALICLSLIQRHHFPQITPKGLILSNPLLRLKIDLPRWADFIFDHWHESLSKLKLPYDIDGYQIGADIRKAGEFNADPLVIHQISAGLYKEILKNSHALRTSSYFLDLPTMLLLGERDPLCDVEASKLFFKSMPKESSQLNLYPHAKHDLFNEVGRELMFEDIYQWVSKLST